jgi:hypothetical protein
MPATEVVLITGPGPTPPPTTYNWVEIADAGHTNIQFRNDGSVSHIGFGETAPTDGFPIQPPLGALVRIEGANTKVWARIIGDLTITVMRGDGRLTQPAY